MPKITYLDHWRDEAGPRFTVYLKGVYEDGDRYKDIIKVYAQSWLAGRYRIEQLKYGNGKVVYMVEEPYILNGIAIAPKTRGRNL